MAINVGTLEAILKLRDEMSPSLKGAIGTLAKATIAMVSFAGAAKLAASALAAQAEKEAGVNKLNLALANQGRLTTETSRSLIDYSSALQDVSTFSAGAILSAEATLAQFGLNEEQIKATTKAALDFAAATGKELPDALQNITAGIMGQGRAFKAYGIELEDTGSKTKNLEQLLGQLEQKFGGSAAAATKTYTGQLAQLKNAFSDVMEGLGKLLGEVAGADKPFSVLIDIAKWLSNFFGVTLVIALSEARARFAEFVAGIFDMQAKIASSGFGKGLLQSLGLDADAGALKLAAEDQRKYATEIRAAGDASAAAAGKTQTYKNAAKTTFSDITAAGREAAKKAAEEAEKLASVLLAANKAFHEEALKTWDEWGKRADQNIDNVVSEYMRLSALLGPTLGEVEASFKDLNTEAMRRGGIGNLNDAELRKFISGMEELGDTGKLTGKQWEVLGDAYTEAMKRGLIATVTAKDSVQDWADSLGGIANVLGQVREGLVAMGVDGNSAMMRITVGLQTTASAASNFLAAMKKGDTFGMIASGIAGAIGIAGALGIGGNKAIMEVNDLRDAFFEAQGGFVALQKKLQGLTNQDLVKKIFDARTVDQFNDAVKEVTDLLDLQAASEEALKEAVDRYGFSIEELGPKYRQQELDKMAAGLLQDYKLLTASGIDQTLVISKMGPAMNEYVQTALKAGAQIPISMKPQIDAMIAAGQLLDANGNAYGSAEAAGITYAQTMSEMFTTLIDKINQMVSALLGIPTDVNTNINVTRHESGDPGTPGDQDGGPGNPGDEDNDPATPFASGGIVTKPTLGLVGEAGPEAIIPLDRLGELLSGFTAILASVTDDALSVMSSMTKPAGGAVDAIKNLGLATDVAVESADVFHRKMQDVTETLKASDGALKVQARGIDTLNTFRAGNEDRDSTTALTPATIQAAGLVAGPSPERADVTPRGERGPGASTTVTMSPSFHIDPLQSNAGRADLGKFLMAQFFREARNSPMLRQVLREGGR